MTGHQCSERIRAINRKATTASVLNLLCWAVVIAVLALLRP